MKKRLLITGITGFTGPFIRQEFERAGWEVFGFGTRPSEQSNYAIVELGNLEKLSSYVKFVTPNAVIHLAGIAYAAHNTPQDYYNIHVQGTLNLLEALMPISKSVQKVILASTSNVYGNNNSAGLCEDAPLKPFNDYGVSKLAMEYMAWLWRDKLPIAIARPFNYTGVGQSERFIIPKIIAHFKKRADKIELGRLDTKRDYSDVRDIAFAYRRLIEEPRSAGGINLCSGNAVSVLDIISMVNKLSGHEIAIDVNPALIRDNEAEALIGNSDKFDTLVPDHRRRSLEDTLSWMLNSN